MIIFSKNGWCIALNNKTVGTIKNKFSNITLISNAKPCLIGTDDGKDLVRKTFTGFPINIRIKTHSRYKPKAAVSAEIFKRTLGDCLKEPVFKKISAIWIFELPKVLKELITTFILQ